MSEDDLTGVDEANDEMLDIKDAIDKFSENEDVGRKKLDKEAEQLNNKPGLQENEALLKANKNRGKNFILSLYYSLTQAFHKKKSPFRTNTAKILGTVVGAFIIFTAITLPLTLREKNIDKFNELLSETKNTYNYYQFLKNLSLKSYKLQFVDTLGKNSLGEKYCKFPVLTIFRNYNNKNNRFDYTLGICWKNSVYRKIAIHTYSIVYYTQFVKLMKEVKSEFNGGYYNGIYKEAILKLLPHLVKIKEQDIPHHSTRESKKIQFRYILEYSKSLSRMIQLHSLLFSENLITLHTYLKIHKLSEIFSRFQLEIPNLTLNSYEIPQTLENDFNQARLNIIKNREVKTNYFYSVRLVLFPESNLLKPSEHNNKLKEYKSTFIASINLYTIGLILLLTYVTIMLLSHNKFAQSYNKSKFIKLYHHLCLIVIFIGIIPLELWLYIQVNGIDLSLIKSPFMLYMIHNSFWFFLIMILIGYLLLSRIHNKISDHDK